MIPDFRIRLDKPPNSNSLQCFSSDDFPEYQTQSYRQSPLFRVRALPFQYAVQCMEPTPVKKILSLNAMRAYFLQWHNKINENLLFPSFLKKNKKDPSTAGRHKKEERKLLHAKSPFVSFAGRLTEIGRRENLSSIQILSEKSCRICKSVFLLLLTSMLRRW